MRGLEGYYNALMYEIVDIETDEVVYQAGNNPHDSSISQSLPANAGVGLFTMHKYCRQTGREMAAERGVRWRGAHYKKIREDE
jgi:hypothetical protein